MIRFQIIFIVVGVFFIIGSVLEYIFWAKDNSKNWLEVWIPIVVFCLEAAFLAVIITQFKYGIRIILTLTGIYIGIISFCIIVYIIDVLFYDSSFLRRGNSRQDDKIHLKIRNIIVSITLALIFILNIIRFAAVKIFYNWLIDAPETTRNGPSERRITVKTIE
uniref:MARVEL domain-containing protein n=1 Tax=Caenorhabditis tropicalis TaxID=1561998 RepID=A0A1I7TBE6_9PELO